MIKSILLFAAPFLMLLCLAYLPYKAAMLYQNTIIDRVIKSDKDPPWTWSLAESVKDKCKELSLTSRNCKRANQVYQSYLDHTANVKEFGY